MVSLLHDVIVTVGVFSLLQLQFDLTIVAALLTIIGFSINDTVVVFDRVRENLRKYKKMPLQDVMNLALNETLSRTFMTVLTVLIALFALLVLRRPGGVRLRLRDDLRRGDRHLLVDLGGERHRALARGQARLGDQGREQGRHAVRRRQGLNAVRTTEVDFEGRLPIDGYGAGGFRVAGGVHAGRWRCVPEGPVSWDGLPDLGPFLERVAEFDVLLVGMGAEMAPLPEALRCAARARSRRRAPGVEIMATPSACRTYNVLLAEGRRVAAALMPV